MKSIKITKKMTKAVAASLALALCVTAFPADADAAKARRPKLSKIKITLKVGQKQTLNVKNIGKKKIKWSSTKKRIVTVTKKGVIRAVKPGKAVVKAKIGKTVLKCTVTVKKKPVKKTNTATTTQKKEDTRPAINPDMPTVDPVTPDTPSDDPQVPDTPSDEPDVPEIPDNPKDDTEYPVYDAESVSKVRMEYIDFLKSQVEDVEDNRVNIIIKDDNDCFTSVAASLYGNGEMHLKKGEALNSYGTRQYESHLYWNKNGDEKILFSLKKNEVFDDDHTKYIVTQITIDASKYSKDGDIAECINWAENYDDQGSVELIEDFDLTLPENAALKAQFQSLLNDTLDALDSHLQESIGKNIADFGFISYNK